MAGFCSLVLVLLLACVVWGAWLNYIAIAHQDTCGPIRYLNFLNPKEGHYLKGHVFLNLSFGIHEQCEEECLLERECVSINIGPSINNIRACELSDSDGFLDRLGLKASTGWTYRGTVNPCSTYPCLNNGKCSLGCTDKKFFCECPDGYTGGNCEKVYKNCAELYKAGHRISGVYPINPDNAGAFDVYCDQTTAGGGWTVFQKRLDGSVDFYRGWDEYKGGFGNMNNEYWLGLDKIHRLTKSRGKLRVDLEDTAGKTAYAEYDSFVVANEANKYKLSLGTYSGTAGDSLSYHHGMTFSTKDRDHNDCAKRFKGAWWYADCHVSNLNGLYLNGAHSSFADGVNWEAWKGYHFSAKRAEMKIKPVNV